jgi:hypothetical protein
MMEDGVSPALPGGTPGLHWLTELLCEEPGGTVVHRTATSVISYSFGGRSILVGT